MSSAAPPDPIDYDDLAEGLGTLANPNRLRILRQLLTPRTVGEIHIPAAGNPRPVSRQGVRLHVEKLLDAGAVHVRAGRRSSGPVQEFLVNHARLFALGEEFRKLGALRPVERWDSATLTGAAGAHGPRARGPRLVLVHGVGEGRAFPLQGAGRKTAWTMGRQASCDVPLDFDPFVSGQNTAVETDGDGFLVRDLPTSRNGTRLNWEPLPTGGSAPLETGDVVGVGRTLLLFRT